ncbi:MAG TPA: hypothetical protein VJ865_11360 [Gemmatimonadaceae bacterium]|nr:hypothetical protein [Gemmatimonadaceae bacterium]
MYPNQYPAQSIGPAALGGTFNVKNYESVQAAQPVTPLQARLNDLHDAASMLEEAMARLHRRFDHLMPPQPPTGASAGNVPNPEPMKSEVSLRLDDAILRIRRCISSAEILMERSEA